jgi:DNA polymerase I-like protein with 3'-5' exonuclease and polymerase domains
MMLQRGTNLQNIPKKHRNVLVASPGKLLLAPDMSQVEGRCVAVASGDPALMRAYLEAVDWPGHPKHGQIDSHTVVQKLFYDHGVEISRQQAKRTTYAAFYGASPDQLAVELNAEAMRQGGGTITKEQMRSIFQMFFALFVKVPEYHRAVVESMLQYRRVRSPTGRERTWSGYIRETRKANAKWNPAFPLRHKLAKEGWSYSPQDMGAWLLAEALDRLHTQARGLVQPILHVHDELVVEIPEQGRLMDEAIAAVTELMPNRKWGMDFPVDIGEPAKSWKEAK